MAEVAQKAQVDLGLDASAVESVVKILQVTLSDEMVLYTKLRNYHWNVTGMHFISLHRLFEEQYEALAEVIDAIAERIRAYGAKALGTMAEFLQHARLKELPGEYPSAREMIANLVQDHEALVRAMREDEDALDELDDVAGQDLLTGLLQKHQDMAWMLRAFLEGDEA